MYFSIFFIATLERQQQNPSIVAYFPICLAFHGVSYNKCCFKLSVHVFVNEVVKTFAAYVEHLLLFFNLIK